MNYSIAVQVNIQLLDDNKLLNRVNLMFPVIFVVLKLVTDWNCRVWRVGWVDVGCMCGQILIEMVFIELFYSWYKNKVSILKFALTENLKS
jgi:hypothetical protein